ncbi:MAG: N-acetylglucosamine-6-phosphate deacetylase [Pseudomonadota bacterium]
MSQAWSITFRNGPIFDGTRLLQGHAARFEEARLTALRPEAELPVTAHEIDLGGDILSPGYVDLQVNGGGGVMLNDTPDLATVKHIAAAHRGLGVAALLPTLITDTVEKTHAAIAAVAEATTTGVPWVKGLHLEGPHLSPTRKGAHDADLIRPMGKDDLETLLEAASTLPVLKVTVAPESVSEDQVSTLARAGVLVSLGHSDANFDTCCRYVAAGARCVTHLFNAMSQLGNREPGLVGAALAKGEVCAGLIADAIHVHPQTMRAAWTAKADPGRIFLVSDAMAVAGSNTSSFELGGRTIQRADGRLTLPDGTLAGADLDLTTALRTMVSQVGVPLDHALQAATSVPGHLIGMRCTLENMTEVIRISSDLTDARPIAETASIADQYSSPSRAPID